MHDTACPPKNIVQIIQSKNHQAKNVYASCFPLTDADMLPQFEREGPSRVTGGIKGVMVLHTASS
jgi:hypothetical protein